MVSTWIRRVLTVAQSLENTMTNSVTIFTQSSIVSFVDAKNVSRELTAEAAIHKGGAALSAIKDMALDSALAKAHNGKYRAAAEILMGAFPSQHKAFEKLFGTLPWENKSTFLSYIGAMENVKPGKSGEFNKKQANALALMRAIRNIPSFAKVAASEGEVIEAVEA